jgi:hypothetical protein
MKETPRIRLTVISTISPIKTREICWSNIGPIFCMLLHYTVQKSQSQFCIALLGKYNNPQQEKITPAVTGTLFPPRGKNSVP